MTAPVFAEYWADGAPMRVGGLPAGFLVRVALGETDRAREHVVDFQRTRIQPGADPRMQWSSPVDARDAPTEEDPIYEISDEYGAPLALRGSIDFLAGDWGYPPTSLRYVPCDVRRFRNAEHRAELTRRARELAAAVRRAGGGS